MMRVVWSPRALEDASSALAFIDQERPHNALLVRERVSKSIALLTSSQYGQPGPVAGTFKVFVHKTSHFLVYRFAGKDTLEIVAFIHAARDWTAIDWERQP